MGKSRPSTINFIEDCIENRYLPLKYCLTGEIFADFFTKPLEGATFQIFRAIIQVIPDITPDVDMIYPRAMAKVTSQ